MAGLEIESREKVKRLLKELFQFDMQDLDFGIHRIMRFKRKEIEKFIENELIKAAEQEFKEYTQVGMAELQKEIEKLRAEIIRDFGEETLDEQGNVKRHEDAPKIKDYLSRTKELVDAELTQGQIEDVFNHIYEFFSRYYENGDFLSKRRYGGRERYYVAHKGEEVLLHWATRDQYYVKTTEYFLKYSFFAQKHRVNFVLDKADVELNNAETGNRCFLLSSENFLKLDEENEELDIHFNYRTLTDEEKRKFGTRNVQPTITSNIVKKLLSEINDEELRIELGRKVDQQETTTLEKHIRRYVNKNTADYFIHRNLKSFLERELDFYLKNEVLDLDEIQHMDERNIRMNKVKLGTIRGISKKIIDFLAQIEGFQKRLFEKKKFVRRADYCMTLDHVPEKFYEEIGENELQVAEWKKLFKLDETTKDTLENTEGKKKLSVGFLKSHKNLVLDTVFFDQTFEDRLLETFDNLDERIEGLCIKSENFQALNLLRAKYGNLIKCIYIDPPYNTGKDEFLYKDNFQHSSWLSMLDNRFRLAKRLAGEHSVWFVSVDDNEQHNLRSLMDQILGPDSFVSLIAVVNNLKGRNDRRHIATAHEYMLMYAGQDFMSYGIPLTEAMKKRFEETTEQGERFEWRDLRKRGRPDRREDRPNMYFSIFYNPKKSTFSLTRQKDSDIEICPKRGDGSDGRWRWGRERVAKNLTNLRAYYNKRSKKWEVNHRVYLTIDGAERTRTPKSIWLGGEYSTDVARRTLLNLLPDCQLDHPKAVKQLEHVISHSIDDEGIIMDFFAGSGTTAHAVLNLNAKDGGNRRYIVIEMADYFETVLKPRIQKIMYSSEWKDGLPVSDEGVSHVFKYIYLEQYEDTLNNVIFRSLDKTIQETLYSFEDYLVRYMLDYETKDSPTRLLVETFHDPFDYKIKISRNGEKDEFLAVDLVETFNYLFGLDVERLRTFQDQGRIYRVVFGRNNKRNTVVIWRNMKDLELEKDKKFIEEKVISGNAYDLIFINGDSYVKNGRAIEPEFKKLMGA